ncbi:anthranilate synthase component 1 [Streptomyces sp. Ag82_O1-12]|uniref:anthranilate synthase component I family protein n=1 Tax=unclassified Streptomyces TaxID=2593676 RepID=UPI000BCF8DD1|nr:MULTISPECIES: anthranilate synthase component I family protein [unclassified Streptomyces]SMQ18886.1 anthranilate synthase component 1 [Streptomyces sp. Ag82_O1-12]SOD47926.1 anthranilate synthase component 1 [Streptomyces sp. Ag82_G6-1]
MPPQDRIEVRVAAAELPHHDPLELYERLLDVSGPEDVFLLESRAGAAPDRRSAVVGAGRLAEIRVFAEHVEIDGVPAVASALARAAEEAGLLPEDPAPSAGAGPRRLRMTGPDALWRLLPLAQQVFDVETRTPQTSYAFGFLTSLAYESVWHMETLPPRTKRANGPDITLTLFRDTVWYDLTTATVRHLAAESRAFGDRAPDVPSLPDLAARAAHEPAATGAVPPAPTPASVHDTVSRESFLSWARRCLEHIRIGDIYQIQIGHRIDVRTELAPVDVYRRLRGRNPSPYMYLMPRAGRQLIGASPELYFRIEGDEIEMRPIAGTARRGPDEEENARRVKEMRESTKERAEHIMLVDLCRNDIGRVSRPGTLPVDRLMAVESYSHVFHLVSTVTGHLDEAMDTWDAVRATFPAGTMTGAPKVRAMEIIDGFEQEARGSYAGAVGLVDVRGWSELALCIRSIEYDGTTYSTQSSAGMVAESDPESEWRETLAKMGAAHWALTGEELR